jgi:hypothetical protein
MRRQQWLSGPLETVVEDRRALAIAHNRMDRDIAELVRIFVEAGDVALVIASVNNERIARIGSDVAGLTWRSIGPSEPRLAIATVVLSCLAPYT